MINIQIKKWHKYNNEWHSIYGHTDTKSLKNLL